jgi:FG-GAP-like repeat
MRRMTLVLALIFFGSISSSHAATVKFSTHAQSCSSDCNPAESFYHADLNHDGREDLIWIPAMYMGEPSNFFVALSTADGKYTEQIEYNIPQGKCGSDTQVNALAIGDFNSDGKADVAVAASDGTLYLYLNSGDGSLTLSKTVYTYANCSSLGSPVAVAADFNRDGKRDLALSVNNQLQILFGNGKGAFSAGPITDLNVSQSLALGDFDGDGNADLATLTYDSGSVYVQVAYGNGTGNFPKIVETQLPGTYLNLVSFGDVNNDGKTDIIALSSTKKEADIYAGDSARTFTTHSAVALANCGVDGALVADFDGNGMNDLVLPEGECGSSGGPYTLNFIGHNANGTFAAGQSVYNFPWGFTTSTVVLHADGNMKPDLYVSPCTNGTCEVNTTAVLLNETSGGFSTCQSPMSFQVGAAGPVAMRDVEVWIDGKKKAEQFDGFSNYTFLHKSLSLSAGSHKVSIYAAGWDQSVVNKSFTIDVK